MTNQKTRPAGGRPQPMRWPLLCGLLCLALAAVARAATVPLYVNTLAPVYNVSIPGYPPPTIDATAFDNENSFTINFTQPTINAEMFETWNTVNYTNNGTMIANAALATNGILLSIAPGCGFQFDTQTTNVFPRTQAGSFYNPGTIRVNSALDNADFLGLSTIGICNVNATNIVVPGVIQVGENSVMQFTGKTVDMTRARLAVEGFGVELGLDFGTTGLQNGISGVDYGVGLDANFDWIPSLDLGVNYALSSEFTSTLGPLQQLSLTNSTPYFTVAGVGTSNVIVRAIFIQNQYTNNVTAKVYWGASPFGGGGAFNIEWDGTYVDAATGLPAIHYLYLNDDDVLGSQGPAVINGIPDNFTFFEGNQELFLGAPAAPGFTTAILPPFPTAVTNSYSYANVQFTPSSVATNSVSQKVTNYLANLTGRIMISADSNLDLSLAQISGENYLQLRSPFQFNGSVGARIFSPYSDINIGVTNGFMTVTNLLEPSVPDWNGGVQCWSARWIYVDATGVTNDFRVLLVNSSLTPTTPSEVQDLAFHATNSLVICDVYNILRSLAIDAQKLTLTTNGVVAASPDGELNFQSPTSGVYPNTVQNVWSNSAPYVKWLTNNGAIRVPNLGFFGGPPPASYVTLVNHGLISDYGSQFWANDFESSGVISNGMGSFTLQSQTVLAAGAIIAASNNMVFTTGSLVTSNLLLQAGRSLTLTAPGQLTDTGPGNGSVWIVGTNSVGTGINMPVLPASGDLRGTSITLFAPNNVNVVNTWPALDQGPVAYAYTNNEAVGQLILNALSNAPNTLFYFTGTGASNAIYVDQLQLLGFSDYNSRIQNTNNGTLYIPSLVFNTNLVIYYADAISDGTDVSVKLNGFNTNHLRWVPSYAGYFSGTNLVYGGVTNIFNAALAESTKFDSDGDGIVNAKDPTPFFLSSEVNLQTYFTNANTKVAITWDTIPFATNTVLYTTNLLTAPVTWTVLTNFISPIAYPSPPAPVTVLDSVTRPPRYYRVIVNPWLTGPNGL